MQNIVRSNAPLLPVEAKQFRGGTDIWLRKDIQGPLIETIEGLENTYYEAKEAFLRTSETLDAETVEAYFEKFWERAVAYDPNPKNEKFSDADVLEMLSDFDYRLILLELGV